MARQVVHMAAWDERAGAYRHYETVPEGGEMTVRVSPAYCMHCHGGRFGRPGWMPLMNEMVAPWSQWHAEPEAASQLFHEDLDPEIAAAPTYQEMTGPDLLASAAELEPIVRAGLDRVAGAQLGRRDLETGPAAALELVRPLFCDEELDYVSEFHRSGELPLAAALDPNLGRWLAMAAPEAARPWQRRSKLRLPVRPADEPLTLIPTRAELSTTVERGLVSRGVLSADEVLRVRALDWAQPALSEFRCDLYRSGARRISEGRARTELAVAATAAELAPAIVEELLHVVDGDGALVSLAPRRGELLAFPRAAEIDVLDALARGELETTYAELAGDVQAHLEGLESSAGRDVLATARAQRACAARREYPTAPLYPDRVCVE
jgi:hypothetical protein